MTPGSNPLGVVFKLIKIAHVQIGTFGKVQAPTLWTALTSKVEVVEAVVAVLVAGVIGWA